MAEIVQLRDSDERVLAAYRTWLQETGARDGWSAELILRVSNRLEEVLREHVFPRPSIAMSKECAECYLRHANDIRDAYLKIIMGLVEEICLAEVRLHEAERSARS